MWMLIVRGVVAGLVVVGVSLLAKQYPRIGALLLTLPIVSIVAFVAVWTAHRDLETISQLAKDTLILVPLGLVFFVPLAFAKALGLTFWSALVAGLLVATVVIGIWFWAGPKQTP